MQSESRPESKLLFDWSRQQPDICCQHDSYMYVIRLGDRAWAVRPDHADYSYSANLLDALIEVSISQGLLYRLENSIDRQLHCYLMQQNGQHAIGKGETQTIAFLTAYLEWLKLEPAEEVAA